MELNELETLRKKIKHLEEVLEKLDYKVEVIKDEIVFINEHLGRGNKEFYEKLEVK
jgi:16S rRNA G527 N7-methylase RsmG